MVAKIWRVLAQILFYGNDLIETIKPFVENDAAWKSVIEQLNFIWNKFSL